MRAALLVALLASLAALAAGNASVTAFSTAAPGAALPAAWERVALTRGKPAAMTLVEDEGRTVARIRAEAAAGSLAHALEPAVAREARLRWRWKVDRVVAGADLAKREGDDFAARVYVTFELPDEALTLWERTRLALVRLVYGDRVPAAAICYVWDNKHPVGTSAWNAYTGQVRMVVVESGAERANTWRDAQRDVIADFRAAFGSRYPGALPRVNGVAVSSDTDQTGESVTAWFGDLVLERRP